MKKIKITIGLLLVVAFVTSCEKEIVTLPENGEVNTQDVKNLGLMSKTGIENFGGNLFAIDHDDNMTLYEYDPFNDAISLNGAFYRDTYYDTYEDNSFAFDFNSKDGFVYLLAGYGDSSSDRYFFRYDMDTGNAVQISYDYIESDYGNTYPVDFTFDNDGICYFLFEDGDIDIYDLDNDSMSNFTYVTSANKAGLTYDFDNDRLIYATDTNPVELYSIDLPSGNDTYLFDFYPDYDDYSSANAIEYVGNNKLIASGMRYANIFTVDLANESSTGYLRSGDGKIKDFMFIYNDDFDNDGVLNDVDPFPHSNMGGSVSIDGCSPGVGNIFASPGTTMMDQIDELIAQTNAQYNGHNWYSLHKNFTRGMSKMTYYWTKHRLITRRERSSISRCVRNADVPNSYN